MDHYRVPEKAKRYIDHDLIKKYTELPDFPHGRTKLLYTFLSSRDKDGAHAKDSELYSLVTSLVQVGLDTHDMVEPSERGVSQKHNRPVQLRVLAGDYYSSRFYELLAQAGQVEWVKLLSHAICEVNRLKINFYMMVKHLRLNAEEYLRHMVQIRSALFLSFTGAMESQHLANWPEFFELFTRCELLAEELERMEHPARFRQSWAYWYLLEEGSQEDQRIVKESDPSAIGLLITKYRITTLLNAMLDKHLKQLGQLAARFESDKLAAELSGLVTSFRQLLNNPRVLEEI